MHKRMLFICASLAVLALVAGCGGGGETTTAPPPPPAADQAAGPAGGGAALTGNATITGKISFEGAPPPAEKIQMSADPYCAQNAGANPVTETVKVSDGGLENVIVYIANAPAGTYPTPTTPVEVNQQNCRYIPHVFTMMTNQPLKIKNSDATLHNIHVWAEKNPQYNQGQPVKDMVNETKFAQEEVVPMRCDVHKWMSSFVGVFHHPFHTVSKAAGTFEIPMLPAGSYEVVAWHEKFGKKTAMLTVADNEKKEVTISFNANDKASD